MILMIWKTSITLNEEIMLATGFRQQEMFPQLLVQNMKETLHLHAQTYSKYCIKDSGDGEMVRDQCVADLNVHLCSGRPRKG